MQTATERSIKTHDLKAWPEFFQPTLWGFKNFELRFDGRGYKECDHLVLREFEPCKNCKGTGLSPAYKMPCKGCKGGKGTYTGRVLSRQVNYILRGPQFGLAEGWVIMGLSKL